MARRKRGFMEDNITDSDGSDDENSGSDDLGHRKKPRTTADDDSDEGFGGRPKPPVQKHDWAKAPTFVSTKSGIGASRPAAISITPSPAPSPPPAPTFVSTKSGIGASRPAAVSSTPSPAPSPPPAPTFVSTRSGIGASRPAAISIPTTPSPPASSSSPAPPASDPTLLDTLPSAFGGASRPQRAFVRNGTPQAPPPPQPSLSAGESMHFRKLEGTFGARMLAKMGWQTGTGLGAESQGIVAPIETKVRPKNMGIAFKGFSERTEQSRVEARRRGEVVSDDEEEVGKKKSTKGKENRKAGDAWKKPKKVKTKVEHKTYEQIVAEVGEDTAGPSGLGVIIDATGAAPREVSSLAEVSIASWTPSTDSTRIPEVRHNVRLIAEAATRDLEGLAREAKEIQKRRKTLQDEELRLNKQIHEEAELISRMQQVHLVVDDIQALARQQAAVYEVSLEPFSPLFDKILSQFPSEFDRYRLDEVVVAAIVPIVRRMLSQWNPLEDPTKLLSTFRLWRRALRLADREERPPDNQVGRFGGSAFSVPPPKMEVPMTPFESLLWNIWLPRVRSSINNEWDPRTPQPAVRLYEVWSIFLPPFIRDNFLDQLILPKVSRAVADWSPRRSEVPLKTLVFPWLPHVGLRMEEFLGDARRKLKSLLRGWDIAEGVPDEVPTWREVFNVGDWDTMMLKYIVPKLGAALREEFRVNPRSQDMAPLERVLAWAPLLRGSIFASLLAAEFFPKWLDVLHVWLVQPRPNFDEVAQWYAFWKSVFSEEVLALPAVRDGFTRGLQLMNMAIELGPEAPTKLPRPDHNGDIAPSPAPTAAAKAKKPPARVQEITFRSIVEDYAATHNLIFLPAGRVHERSRMPLFRVSPTADGKGGILVYVLDDAVWASDETGEYRAITLENMVLRATKGGS